MEHTGHTSTTEHKAHHEHQHHDMSGMASSATLHCLTGCAIGEIAGLMIGVSLGWSALATTALAITLAFLSGYTLSALPLLRGGINLKQALKLVLLADTLSIATMEIVDNGVMLLIPGAMDSGVQSPLFWVSMSIALTIAYFVALPVNKHLLKKGQGHAITHGAIGHPDMDNRPLVFGLVGFFLGGLASSVGTLL